MRILVGVVFLLGVGSTPGFAQENQGENPVDGSASKDQLILDLQKKINELSDRVQELEEQEDEPALLPLSPAPAAGLEERIDETIRMSPAEPVREPMRLNFSSPGLDRVSFSGFLRLRGQYWDRLHSAPGLKDSILSFDQRLDLGISLRVTEKTEVYFELHDQRVWGNDTPLSTPPGVIAEEKNLEVSAVYADFSDVYGSGFNFRVGRQKFELGNERHFGEDEWLNGTTRFDGIVGRKTMMDGAGHLTVAALRLADGDQALPAPFFGSEISPVGAGPTTADVYVGYFTWDYMEGEGSNGTADFYVFFVDSDPLSGFRTGAAPGVFGGQTSLVYYGARWEHSIDPIWWEGEFTTHFGKVGGVRGDDYGFDNYAYAARVGFDPDLDFLAGIYAGYDYATGGGNAYIPLFPTDHGWFGIMDFATWANIEHFVVGADLDILADAEDTLSVSYHWLSQQADTGGFAGNHQAGGVAGQKEIGQELDLTYTAQCTDNSTAQLGLGYFLPGDAYTGTFGSSNNVLFGFFQYMMRF